MTDTTEGIRSRINEAESWINDLGDRMVEIIATELNVENRMKIIEDSLTDLLDNTKHTNNHMTGVPVGEEREKGLEKIFEKIIVENFPNMGKEIVNQVQEAQSSRQDKTQEEHTETHSNQTDKN